MTKPFTSDEGSESNGDREPDGASNGSEADGERSKPSGTAGEAADELGATAGDGGQSASIELPESAPLDEPVQPVLTGLAPSQRVTLRYEASDPVDGTVWSGSATFEADDDGVVDLASAAPLAGSYDGVDPTGPLWSMEPDGPPEHAQFEYGTHDVTIAVDVDDRDVDDRNADDRDANDRDLSDRDVDDRDVNDRDVDGAAERTATDDSTRRSRRRLATATTTRVLPDVETSALPGDLVGTIHHPPTDRPAPAVLLLHGSNATELDHVARLFANRGFAATTLQYFGEAPTLPSALAGVPLEYVQRAVDALVERDDTSSDGVGLYGVSKGGELALLAGAHLEGIDAVASVAGSSYVWEGLTPSWQPAGRSSWSVDGEPIDAVPLSGPSESAAPVDEIRDSYERAVDDADTATLEAATIPVERIDAPTLLVSGERDAMWQSTRFAAAAVERLRREDVEFAYEHCHYDDAGHGIAPPFVPTYGRAATPFVPLGGTPAGNAEAAADHWPAVIDHFERALETA